MKISIIGKNSFVGIYFLKKYNTENIKEICPLTYQLEDVSFKDADSIIHLAALVHQMKGAPENEYFKVNSDLAFETAKKEGVVIF